MNIRSNIKSIARGAAFAVAGVALVFSLGLASIVPAAADTKCLGDGKTPVTPSLMDYQNCGQGNNTPNNLFGSGGWITTIINIALFIVGIASVIMIIYSGIRYTTSRGEGKAVESAKNTMLYAIMGLIIAIVAYALINFVISSIAK